MKRLIAIACLGSLFSGCFIDTIKPNELQNYQEKMVVYGTVSNNSSLSFQVTNSKSTSSSELPRLVKDAEVTVFLNQQQLNLTYDLFTDRYENSTVVGAGDAVAIQVSHPDYPNTSTSFRVPDDINANSTLTVNGGIDTSGNTSDLIQVTFADQPVFQNFYIVSLEYYDQFQTRFIPISFPSTDPALAEYNSYRLNNGAILFTDELFNGSTKTLSMVPAAGLVSGNTGDKYRVQLSSITKDLFDYYRSLQRAEEAKEITFEAGYNNAVVIHSNVKNGLGIIGGANVNAMVLK